MKDQKIISKVASVVKEKLAGEGSGHDWWHVHRVWKQALRIGKLEGADLFIVNLSALLHDIADWKFHDGDDSVGPRVARELLEKFDVQENIIKHVCTIITEVSFKGAGVKTVPSTLEGKVVQDADRLDAIGAIGIARTFVYGGNKGRVLYEPSIKPVMHSSKQNYFNNQSSTINHFYEKLLLLKDLMNTASGRAIAENRHKFMKEYLKEFFGEWEGKK